MLLIDRELDHLLYADDLILPSSLTNGLQNCLNALGSYSKNWDLIVSIKKRKTMIFNPTDKMTKEQPFSYLGHSLEIVCEFSYLGITFSISGSVKIKQIRPCTLS